MRRLHLSSWLSGNDGRCELGPGLGWFNELLLGCDWSFAELTEPFLAGSGHEYLHRLPFSSGVSVIIHCPAFNGAGCVSFCEYRGGALGSGSGSGGACVGCELALNKRNND